MKIARITTLMTLLVSLSACMASQQKPKSPPPADPIAAVSAAELRAKGLAYARRGDLIRAQQYLSAAHQKGFDERVVLPEIVKICLAASRLRAALAFAEPYLIRNPGDAGMSYVVGTIHLALGNVQEASAHLNGALRPEKIMIDAAYSLALIAKDHHRPQEARQYLEHYLRVRPEGRYATRAKHMLAELNLVALAGAK